MSDETQNENWREAIKQIGEKHDLLCQTNPNWSQAKTAKMLNINTRYLSESLVVYRNLNSPLISIATDERHAFRLLKKHNKDKVHETQTELSTIGEAIFNGVN